MVFGQDERDGKYGKRGKHGTEGTEATEGTEGRRDSLFRGVSGLWAAWPFRRLPVFGLLRILS